MNTQKELVKQTKRSSRLANIMNVMSVSLDLLVPIVVIHLVARYFVDDLTARMVWVWTTVLLVVLLVKSGCVFCATWLAHRAAYGSLADLRLHILKHLKALPLGFFHVRRTGDLVSVMKNDVEQVEVFLAHGLPETMSATGLPLVVFVVMLAVDWRLALVMVIGLPLMWVVRRLASPKWVTGFATVARYMTAMQERLVEYVANIAVIKAFGKSEDKTAKAIDASEEYVRWVSTSMNDIAVPMGLITLFMESGMVGTVIVGLLLLQDGQISVERLILAMVLSGTFSAAVAKIATLKHYRFMFNQAMTGISSILGQPAPAQRDATELSVEGDLVLDSVSFTYPNKQVPALKDVNLTFKRGSVNALVGSSGCGKTTLAHLLMGFWTPDRGRITVGGRSLADVSEHDWRRSFGLVAQDVFLFNLTLEDSIKVGNPNASHSQVVDAAKRAQIHQFIEALPLGYQTMAGEVGVKFSGGEKQRISIARAMLKNAEIVVLDEATSALDSGNEELVQTAIDELTKDKTVITIAHHLDTIVSADQIIVLDEGSVVDAGTHQQLLSRCETYQRLVRAQHLVDSWDIKAGQTA